MRRLLLAACLLLPIAPRAVPYAGRPAVIGRSLALLRDIGERLYGPVEAAPLLPAPRWPPAPKPGALDSSVRPLGQDF